jgi:glutamate/tyrosine decarboxylase-like PLP-dependent enzyme
MTRPMTVYVSAEGHSCLRRAAELLGVGSRNVREVPVDSAYRMDVTALRAMLAEDDAAFCVAASAGTVNTGAVDPLDDIADVAREHGLWFHVDGAYGAFGILGPDPAPGYAGMHRADSLAVDPHKWLGVPVDCGCVLLRSPSTARDAFSLVPPYLRAEEAWLSEYGPEQTRPFRALRAWATMSHLGRAGIVSLIAHTTGLARTLGTMVTEADDFELLAPVVNSIAAFRFKPAGVPAERLDELNRAVPGVVRGRGRAFLTGTRLGGVEALRACVLHPGTTEADLGVLVEEIRRA